MSQVHQSFQTDLDPRQYEAGLKRMETATQASTSRMTREFGKIDQSVSRQGRSLGGMRAGQAAMQMQDIGIQMQMGARASTIIAQQGSQILSIFGPHGMLLGGLVAAGAMFWEVVRGAKALNKEAQETKKIAAINANTAANKRAVETLRTDKEATDIAKVRAASGKEAADQAERELEFKKKIAAIEADANLSAQTKAVLKEQAQERFDAENGAAQKVKDRQIREGIVDKFGEQVGGRAAQIRGDAPSKAEARREARAQRNAERRAINEEIDRVDRQDRNKRQDFDDPNDKIGLGEWEKEDMRAAGRKAVDAAKNDKQMAEISDDNIVKVINAIEKLLTK